MQPLETEFVPQSPIPTPEPEVFNTNLSELTNSYKSIKSNASKVASQISSSTTLSGMDSINVIISDGMKDINRLMNNGKKVSTFSSIKNKALSVIDPGSKWAAKWLDDTKEKIEDENIKESSIDEIADRVISAVEKQREDVISFMESMVGSRASLLDDITRYTDLLAKAKSLLTTLTVDTREEMDTKSLITRLNKSLMQADSTISNEINPLVASARIAITEIDAQLPDMEHDLKYKGSLKVAQQSLSDLIGMAKAVKNMTEQAGDAIREDIYATTLESINMVGDVMIDTDRMKKLQLEEQAHMKKVNDAMRITHDKINKNFEEINQLQLAHADGKNKSSAIMIENYADIITKETL